jgi:DNA-binding SARP family transcriptional activator
MQNLVMPPPLALMLRSPATIADRLEIRLLGGFDCRSGRQPVALPTRKCMGLLALLALRPGEPVGRERLSALLWSRSAPAQARASLRQALAMLRRTLERDGAILIDSVRDGVRLRPEWIDSDAAELQSALDQGSPESLMRAATLYRGHLLDGFVLFETPFDDWREGESERLRQRTQSALGGLLARQVRSGDRDGALALGKRLLELDPAAEEVREALSRLGNRRGAASSGTR